MYNGIGLQTPRGSGTNGYVQKNQFFVRPRAVKVEHKEFKAGEGTGGITRKANPEILEHDLKRQIELKILLLRETLVEQGYTEEEVMERVDQARKELQQAPAGDALASSRDKKNPQETHKIAARKAKQMEVMRNALGLGDVKEGEAFDRELQEQRKQDRMEAREKAERERKQRELERQEEEKKRDKERQKQLKEEKREMQRLEKEKRRREEEERHREEEESREEKRRKKLKRRREEEEELKKEKKRRELRKVREEEERRRKEEKRRQHDDETRHKEGKRGQDETRHRSEGGKKGHRGESSSSSEDDSD